MTNVCGIRDGASSPAGHDNTHVSRPAGIFKLPENEQTRITSDIAQLELQRGLAVDFLSRNVGCRLATTVEYQEAFDVGAGTVLKAIAAIEETSAVVLRRRGYQGTHILKRDVGRLWYLAHLPTIRIAMPPPGPLDLAGLTQALQYEFERLGVPVRFDSMGGSRRRIEAVLTEKVHLAVLSEAAYELEARHLLQRMANLRLAPNSFYTDESLTVLFRSCKEPYLTGKPRIGIDLRSSDHKSLTYAEFPDDGRFEFVELKYNEGPAALLQKQIDFAVWHACHLLVPLHLMGIGQRPLSSAAETLLRREMSRAVIAIRSERLDVLSIISEIDPVALATKQSNFLTLDRSSPEFRESIGM